MTTGDPSVEYPGNIDSDRNVSFQDSLFSYRKQESVAESFPHASMTNGGRDDANNMVRTKQFQLSLSNRASIQSGHKNSGTIRVDLASPEDVSLGTDNSSKAVHGNYGTTV